MKTDTAITERNKTFIQELRKSGKTGPEILKAMLAKDMKTATGKKPNVVYVYNSLQTKKSLKTKLMKLNKKQSRKAAPVAKQTVRDRRELEAIIYIIDLPNVPAANKLNAIRILVQP